MASISAVSKVELLTKAENEEIGTRYEIAGGEELEFDDAGCPNGTTIVVRDIFFNTPARMKFLKKTLPREIRLPELLTEWQYLIRKYRLDLFVTASKFLSPQVTEI